MNNIRVNTETCTSCGTCAIVCPRHVPEVLERDGKKITVVSTKRADLCFSCGQCVAVCPTDSVTVEGLDTHGFLPAEEVQVDSGQFLNMLRNRRSIRRYKNNPVSRETIDQIIEAAHAAPTGAGKNSMGAIVISNPKVLKQLSDGAFSIYEDLDKKINNPVIRFFMKHKIGERLFASLQDFVMPGMRWYIKWRKEGKGDEITRDCPVLILFHSPVMEPVGDENCLVASAFSLLMAQTLGVGGFINGLVPPAVNRSKDLRKLVELPEDRDVYASLSLGYSKYKYRKTVPRRLVEVKYMD